MWTIGSLSVRESALVGTLILDFAIQWGAFAVAAALRTEKFYDLMGSVNFIAAALGTLFYGHYYYARQIVVTVFVCLWALRLGGMLFYRVLKSGGDSRFSDAKTNLPKFFVFWTLQAVWVFITLSPVAVLNGTEHNEGLWASDIIGGAIWVTGYVCEATADFQKLAFKADPANKGKFIDKGLWAYAKYPQYFGEILMWWGIWLMCIAVLRLGYWATVISPLFVMTLTLAVSGVPLQEKQQKERWGKDPAFQAWRRRTNLLVPVPNPWKLKKEKSPELRQNLQNDSDHSQA